MDITHAQLSLTGPVRPHNEDCVGFWQPDTPELRRSHGFLSIIADGVGGESRGEVASRLAVDAALSVFRAARPELPPAKLLRNIFEEASRQVHDASLENPEGGSMSTTLTVSIFRNDEIVIGHVGDSRVYLVRKEQVKRLTTDHCYVALQVKLGLLHERDAMGSPMRSMLTRSLGRELFCRFDTYRHTLFSGDIIVQCTDGLYANLVDEEIADTVRHYPPGEACQRLVALLERRPVDDNFSVQVIRVNQVERVCSYRAATYYHEGYDAPVNSELQPGQILDRRFEVSELINRSGMACIYKAIDRETGEVLALKVPHMQFESDAASFSRFEREEEIGRRLNHPYILKIIPVEGAKSRPYIVMEYLEGQTLAQLVQNVRPMPERDAVRIASRICEALEHMHQHNVVHRDLKPQNIMLCNDGSIRIMDFGIAKATQMRRITFVGFSPTMGTPDYMAPEQVRGRRGDERTDIYSLGAILYEMVTGSVPFEGESPYAIMNARVTGDPVAPRKLNPKITPVLEEIILHALERNPANRYASAAELKGELDDYEKVELTGRHQRLQPPRLWKARFRWLPIVLGFAVLNALAFALLVWYFSHHKGH